MPRFRYEARSPDGRPNTGSVEARSAAEVRETLTRAGLKEIEVTEEPNESPDSPPVSGATERTLAERMADVTSSGLPLEAGLRVMAEEMSGRDRRELLDVCRRLEAGESPEAAMGSAGISPTLVALVRAGRRTGELGQVLMTYVERSRDRADRRGRIGSALLYPAILLIVSAGVITGMLYFIMPNFDSIMSGFDVELPAATEMVLWMSRIVVDHPWVPPAIVMGPLLLIGIVWCVPAGRAVLMRGVNVLPVLGAVTRANGVASFCEMLGMVVSQRVPLPEALRLASAVTSDPDLARSARFLAEDVERGVGAEVASRALPHGLRRVFHWVDDERAFAEGLLVLARVHDARSRNNANLLASLVGPIAILIVAITVGTIMVATFFPLIKLLNDLS